MYGFGPILQIGYLTDDIEQSIAAWTQRSGVGPFTWYQNLSLDATHLGEPTTIEMDAAIAYRGDVQIELIQQHNDLPSPYRTYFDEGRLGMHHLAYGSRDMTADIQRARDGGFDVMCTIDHPTGQYAYFTDPDLPGAIFELIGVSDGLEAYWNQCKAQAETWDGTNPFQAMDLAGT